MTSNGSWQKVRLGDLAQNVTINEYQPLENGLTKYVAGNHLESKKLYITRFGDLKIDKEVIGSAFHRKFSSGDVLFGSRRAYLRKTGIATFDGLCSNTTLVIRKKSDELVNGILPFIFRLGKFTEYAAEKSTGSVTPYVLWRNLANFTFNLPSKPEQLKIKETLWSIQTSIDNLENLLEKTINFMISRRESLLTRGIGHTKFKKVKWFYGKTIEIPEEWEITKIHRLVKNIQSGVSRFLSSNDIGFPVLRSGNINNGKLDFSDIKYWYKDDTKGVDLKKYILQENDVLLNFINSVAQIGKTCIFSKQNRDWIFTTNIFRIQTDENVVSPQYFNLLLNSLMLQYQIRSITQLAVNQASFTQDDFKQLLVIIPALPEQQKITSILTNIDKQITQQQSHLNNLYQLQDSILNSKLTKEKTNVAN